jgi:hypothetical protein
MGTVIKEVRCPNCHRTTRLINGRCVYCGVSLSSDSDDPSNCGCGCILVIVLIAVGILIGRLW